MENATTTEGLIDFTTEVVTEAVGQVSRWCSACVAQYLESRASRVLWTYVSPALVVMGTVGNLLTLAVLRSRYHKASPINVALAFLAVADLGVLLVGLMHQWIRFVWGFDARVMSNVLCKLHLTFTLFVMALSPNILALTTVERALSVLWPLHVGAWVTRKRMMCACVLLTSFVFACHLPLFVTVYLDPSVPAYRMCQWHDPTFTKVWYWVSFVLDFLGPFTIIVTGNACIIAHLTIARARRSEASEHTGKSMDSSSTTVMLVVVGVVYMVTMTPHNIYRLGQAYSLWPTRPEAAYARLQLVIAVGFQLMYTNSAINFLLYCLAGARFRSSLRKMVSGDLTRRGDEPGVAMETKSSGSGTGSCTGSGSITKDTSISSDISIACVPNYDPNYV